jgi:hypothetical protein
VLFAIYIIEQLEVAVKTGKETSCEAKAITPVLKLENKLKGGPLCPPCNYWSVPVIMQITVWL